MIQSPRKSRLSAQLDAAVAAARNPIERRRAQAERAALWARQGQLAEAEAALVELRSSAALQPAPAADVWLSLAEGVLAYYRDLGREAHEQFERADREARALPVPQPAAQALAAAWRAHLSFTRDEFESSAGLLREVLEYSGTEAHAGRARAALTAAFAYHFAGRADRALPWHELSRRIGLTLGDDAHLSALMHNQAALRANAARLSHLFGDHAPDNSDLALAHHLAQALMVAESVDRFDDGIGTAALRSLVPALQAQMLTAQGRWQEALVTFDTHLQRALQQGMGHQAPCLHADAAWCAWHLQQHGRVAAEMAAAEAGLREHCDADDRAMALARLAQLHAAMNQPDLAAQVRQQAQQALASHRAHQRALEAALNDALIGLDPAALRP